LKYDLSSPVKDLGNKGITGKWSYLISQGNSDFCETDCKTPLDYGENKDHSIYVEENNDICF